MELRRASVRALAFALLIVGKLSTSGRESILSIVVATVLLSVFAHGLTAQPGARWYASRVDQTCREEHAPVSEMPLRISADHAREPASATTGRSSSRGC